MNIIKPRGTRDIFFNEMEKRRNIEFIWRKIVQRWGYKEINTPTFENLELFTLKSGNDIVKELYTFLDKGKRKLTLRPELTAPVTRAYINEMQSYPKPIKLFYFENCFRYERPQRGRYREFWQFGIEIIGGDGLYSDAEIIALSVDLLSSIGIEGELNIGNLKILKLLLDQMSVTQDVKNEILHLIDKKEYDKLNKYIDENNISLDLKNKLINLISLDEKDPITTIEKAKTIIGNIEELDYMIQLIQKLKVYGIETFKINFNVSRGLDYYTGIVFEIYNNKLGSQKQICGGGSYNLIKLFCKENIISTGFGIGFDRIVELCNIKFKNEKSIFIISKKSTYNKAIKLAKILRTYLCVNLELMDRSFNSQLSYANTIESDYVLFFGDKELNENHYILKHMKTGKQMKVNLEQLIHEIENNRRLENDK